MAPGRRNIKIDNKSYRFYVFAGADVNNGSSAGAGAGMVAIANAGAGADIKKK